jgi:hypothetical protein
MHMPQRNREKTVKFPLQGDDAFIKVRMPTLKEMQFLQTLQTDYEETADQEQAARKFLAEFLLEWNLVDDYGVELAQPHSNPNIFEQLTNEEVKFIYKALAGQDEPTKAAKKK